ncbi:thioredoxin-dependent thiol peroxidase [Erysipelothrix urinaevulpis]|uniref:thioredoxin-dependent thiol peroxidase n=1 Tax=Erysipelothrix urinaevulpis TaxID=2683717 RepID=UPI00135BC31F|nr:thioredoxin-dependent thiol peroxidase [Erysipelothrix urinaevulpis]
MLKIGQKAPNFTLKNQDGEDRSLTDYLGKKVVLYFYPKDNTPGCTSQACSFRDYNQEIKELGAVVLGISKDSVQSHQRFAEKQALSFDILSDETMEVIQAYGVWKEKTMFGKTAMGVQRATYIIDEHGNIEKIYEKAKAKHNAGEIVEYLKEK